MSVDTSDVLAALRFTLRMRANAEWSHYDTHRRWHARCNCGEDWPCPAREDILTGTKIVYAALTDLLAMRGAERGPAFTEPIPICGPEAD